MFKSSISHAEWKEIKEERFILSSFAERIGGIGADHWSRRHLGGTLPPRSDAAASSCAPGVFSLCLTTEGQCCQALQPYLIGCLAVRITSIAETCTHTGETASPEALEGIIYMLPREAFYKDCLLRRMIGGND